MTYQEAIAEFEKLGNEGKLSKQTVEVVTGTKKYFIHHIDFRSDKIMLKIDRSHYTPITHAEFVQKMKEARDMVNPTAAVEVVELGKSEGNVVNTVYCSDDFVELVAD
jgi:hypothetical protein